MKFVTYSHTKLYKIMKINNDNYDALYKYVREYFNKSKIDMDNNHSLVENVTNTLMLLYRDEEVPEYKIRLILSTLAVAWSTGRGEKLDEITKKYDLNIKYNV